MVNMDTNSNESSLESFYSETCTGLTHSTPVKTDIETGTIQSDWHSKHLNTSSKSLENVSGKAEDINAKKSVSVEKIKIAKVILSPEKKKCGNKSTAPKNVKFNKTSEIEKSKAEGKGLGKNFFSTSSSQVSAISVLANVVPHCTDDGDSLASTLESSVILSEPSFLSTDTSLTDDVPPRNQLGAWEKWFLKKEEGIRKKQEEKRKKEEEMKKEAARKERERKEKLKLEIANRKIWVAGKQKEGFEKKLAEEQKKMKEEEKKCRKEEEFKKQAEERFNAWIVRKEREKQASKEQEVSQLEQSALMKRYRLEQSKLAFHEWQKRALERPKTAPCTFGYCGGTVVGFYDATRAPPPTFVNPMPWQSPATPNKMPSFWDTPCHHHHD